MFEFQVNLDDDDYLLFNKYHSLNSRNGKRALILSFFAFPITGLIIAGLEFMSYPDMELLLINAVVFAIITALWILLHKKIYVLIIKHGMKKLKKEGKLPYSKEAILKFNEDSIREITPDTETKTNYSLIEKVAVTEQAIYIYIGAVQAYIVPSDAFLDENEKQKFLEFIRSKAIA